MNGAWADVVVVHAFNPPLTRQKQDLWVLGRPALQTELEDGQGYNE